MIDEEGMGVGAEFLSESKTDEVNVLSSVPSPKPEGEDSSADHIVLPKKIVYGVGVGIVSLLIGLLFWQLNALESLQLIIFPATAVVTVVDATSKEPLNKVTVVLGDTQSQTGSDGITVLDDLTTREYTINATLSGYVDYKDSVLLERGRNNITIALDAFQARTDVGGKVFNYIDGSVVEGAKLTYKDQEKVTTSDGGFLFTDVPVGVVKISVSKDGYNPQALDVQLSSRYQIDINLVPEGKTVFVSNRDNGKKAIYVANFDGTGVTQLIKRIGETQDYGVVLSPLSQKVAFLSTRDEKLNTDSGQLDADLYVVSIDGEELRKIGSHYGISGVTWSFDESSIVWVGRVKYKDYTSHLYVYSFVTGVVSQLDTGGISTMVVNSKDTGVAWSESISDGDPTSRQGIYYYDFATKKTTQVFEQSSWSVGFTDNDSTLWFQYYDGITGEYIAKAYDFLTQKVSSIDSISTQFSQVEFASLDKLSVVYVGNRDGKSDVYVSDTNGENERKLSSLGSVATILGWDKTGEYILFDAQSATETARYIVGLTGAPERKISDIYLEYNGYGPGY
ncbi:hypothetical protein GW793_03755 [bacterium]|uniref:PEGA domain-containing protein n=2 Tax=Katanobacteria TaxID=422282 RepID=A0A2H0BGC0_UNCKA|nr:hypothetical protein [bacterium]PIP56674.1 MAG: hypothetical protein COX05_01850 [candidate division WWE3 bacterium CG22_combo_CG10-13_8_21_14_all_39_12]